MFLVLFYVFVSFSAHISDAYTYTYSSALESILLYLWRNWFSMLCRCTKHELLHSSCKQETDPPSCHSGLQHRDLTWSLRVGKSTGGHLVQPLPGRGLSP